MQKLKRCLLLFWTFFKIGLFTFGGGYAMIAVIEGVCVEKKKWITHDDMMNVTVIAEATPGPISINCATFVGYQMAGFLGALFATLGVVLPSFIIIYVISLYLDAFLAVTWVANAFKGIKIAVGILIISAGVNMFKKVKKTPFNVVLFALSLALMLAFELFDVNVSSIVLILSSGVVGAVAFLLHNKKEPQKFTVDGEDNV